MFSKFDEVNLELQGDGVKNDDIAVYYAHLAELHRDMSVRFNNLFSLEIPGWVIDPFTEPSTSVPTHLEEELVSLQNDLLPSLLDANSDPKTLPNPVERHQVVFHCFSDFLHGREGIQCSVQAPHQTKKQTQHNGAW